MYDYFSLRKQIIKRQIKIGDLFLRHYTYKILNKKTINCVVYDKKKRRNFKS